MTHYPSTLIVIPAWNEEESVSKVVRDVLEALPNVTCLVVSDGSTDTTAVKARLAGAQVLELPFNLGVGGAMRLGFKHAIENGFLNVVQIDADGQHDPKCVPELLDKLQHFDLVIGARFAGKESYNVKGPRRWAMWFLSKALSIITKSTLTDTTSGLKANGPKAVQLFAENFPTEYLGDTIEALVIASKAGCKITQVPVSMREREGGNPSHSPAKAALYLGRAVFALFFALLRPQLKR